MCGIARYHSYIRVCLSGEDLTEAYVYMATTRWSQIPRLPTKIAASALIGVVTAGCRTRLGVPNSSSAIRVYGLGEKRSISCMPSEATVTDDRLG